MPFNQDLTGAVEPKAKTWLDATPAERRWYYGQVAAIAERRKRIELMQAVGRFGVMDPRKRPRKDGADGPVMDPHGGASRTFRLLTSSHTERGCMLYWRTAWTTILGYHADGMVRGAPIRDVRLSDSGIAAVQSEGESLWRKRPKAAKATTPKPGPATTPAAPPPKPVPSPVKGETVKTALPKGPLKGPGLIDTKALKPKPKPAAPAPAPTPKPAPAAAPSTAPPPKPTLVKPPTSAPAPKPVPKPAPKPVQVIPPPKPKPVPIPPKPAAAAPVPPKAAPPPPPPPPKPAPWQPRKQSEFQAFGSSKDMEAFGEASFKAWADGLSQPDKNAIKLYAADNYKWMNAILRGADPATVDLPHGLSEQGAKDYIARTIAPLARGVVDRDVVAYRGVRSLDAMGIDAGKLVQGQELTIEGFLSTTLRKDKANDFAVGNVGPGSATATKAILQVNTPKGSSGGYLNAAELSGYSDERELLMPPDVTLRFVRLGGTHKDVWGNETPILVFERVR